MPAYNKQMSGITVLLMASYIDVRYIAVLGKTVTADKCIL